MADEGGFGLEQGGVAAAVGPGAAPFEAQAGADVGGGADAGADSVAGGEGEFGVYGDVEGDVGEVGAGADADVLEEVAVDVVALEGGDLVGGIGVACAEGDEAAEEGARKGEGRDADFAEAEAGAGIEGEGDVGAALAAVDEDLIGGEGGAEVAAGEGEGLDGALGFFVAAVVEDVAGA